jgi:TonB-linked SusC/RagA family outer membrane protein
MHEDEAALEEVLVTGYQNIRKHELTGSIKQLKADDVLEGAKLSIDQMLTGQVAGMLVTTGSGEPSATPKIRIRGTSSIISNKAPLWVLDGIILNDIDPTNSIDYSNLDGDDAAYLIGNAIAGINPRDIESINVLKDAAATALYGVQAANGVIVVTTKKGRSGPPLVSYTGSVTVNMRDNYNKLNLMDATERIQLSEEIMNSGMQLTRYATDIGYEGLMYQRNNKGEFEGKRILTDNDMTAALNVMKSRNTDWYDILFRNALSLNHSVNVSGGNESTTYYASVGYTDAQGTAIGSESKRYTAMAKLATWLGHKLYLNMQLNGTVGRNKGFGGSSTPDQWAYTTSRTIPAYYENGNLFYYQTGYNDDETSSTNVSPLVLNYLNELENTGSEGKTSSLTGKLDLRWNIWDKLRYEFSGSIVEQLGSSASWATHNSYSVAMIRGYNYNDPLVAPGSIIELSSPLPYGGRYSDSHTKQTSYTVRNQLAYEKEVVKNHVFSAQVTSEIRSIVTKGHASSAIGWRQDRGQLISPIINEYNFSAIDRSNLINQRITDNIKNYVSWLGFASYAYQSKAMLNANIRMDGSNQFGDNPKYRFLPVWSVSGRYIITEEPFLKQHPVISYLALRASYGVQGNVDKSTSPDLVARIGAYDTYRYLERSTIEMMPNPDLRWEKTVSYNAGIDFSLWNKRISGTVDVYHKAGSDIILSVQMSQVNGNNTHKINAGSMTNSGIELDLSAYLVRTKQFDASLNFIYAYNRNVLTKANILKENSYDGSGIVRSNLERINGSALIVGEALGTIYSYRFAGLDHEHGLPIFYEQGKSTYLVNGVETPNYTSYLYAVDLVKSGVKTPPTTGAINPALRYGNFRLRGIFAFSLGAVKRLPSLLNEATFMLNPTNNVSREYLNRWKQPGDELYTHIPALYNSDTYSKLPKKPVFVNGLSYNVYNGSALYDKSDIRIASTDNIRMNNLSLSYLLPQKFCHSIHVSEGMFTFQVTNLFLIADKAWNGRDPEQTSTTASLPSTYTGNITITF